MLRPPDCAPRLLPFSNKNNAMAVHLEGIHQLWILKSPAFPFDLLQTLPHIPSYLHYLYTHVSYLFTYKLLMTENTICFKILFYIVTCSGLFVLYCLRWRWPGYWCHLTSASCRLFVTTIVLQLSIIQFESCCCDYNAIIKCMKCTDGVKYQHVDVSLLMRSLSRCSLSFSIFKVT